MGLCQESWPVLAIVPGNNYDTNIPGKGVMTNAKILKKIKDEEGELFSRDYLRVYRDLCQTDRTFEVPEKVFLDHDEGGAVELVERSDTNELRREVLQRIVAAKEALVSNHSIKFNVCEFTFSLVLGQRGNSNRPQSFIFNRKWKPNPFRPLQSVGDTPRYTSKKVLRRSTMKCPVPAELSRSPKDVEGDEDSHYKKAQRVTQPPKDKTKGKSKGKYVPSGRQSRRKLPEGAGLSRGGLSSKGEQSEAKPSKDSKSEHIDQLDADSDSEDRDAGPVKKNTEDEAKRTRLQNDSFLKLKSLSAKHGYKTLHLGHLKRCLNLGDSELIYKRMSNAVAILNRARALAEWATVALIEDILHTGTGTDLLWHPNAHIIGIDLGVECMFAAVAYNPDDSAHPQTLAVRTKSITEPERLFRSWLQLTKPERLVGIARQCTKSADYGWPAFMKAFVIAYDELHCHYGGKSYMKRPLGCGQG
ncbi:hypothetical protein SeLEV6574_g02859 [Synchytrium endobioticum]|uniref:Uncharacterized protein n=1 Tax=Synchytrium endobioticum TaxID=286115 RepID=A0A507D6P8_9FUNG|nr:hypothetical protein SeLEV6574_g02859 [Synchytrium endobioticum]